MPPDARGGARGLGAPAASRRRRSSGCSSARCRSSASSRTRSSSRPSALLLGLALVTAVRRPVAPGARRAARVAERLARRLRRAPARAPSRRAVRAGDAVAARRGRRRSAPLVRRRLCLAAMADELQAGLPDRRQRPAEGRPRGRAAARPLRRRTRSSSTTRRRRRGDDAVAACNAHGPLRRAASRLVVVEGVEAWKAADAKAVAAYLKSPAPGTTLALVAGELKKDAPLAKAVARHGELLLWDVAERGPCRAGSPSSSSCSGVDAEPEACRAARRARRRRPLRARERGRQARHLGGRRARSRAADVEALVAPRAESPPWNLTDAWGARDVGGVLRATEHMLDRTGDPRLEDDPAARRQPDEARPERPRGAPASTTKGCRTRTPPRGSASSRIRRRSSTRRSATSAPTSSTTR